MPPTSIEAPPPLEWTEKENSKGTRYWTHNVSHQISNSLPAGHRQALHAWAIYESQRGSEKHEEDVGDYQFGTCQVDVVCARV